MRVYVDTNVFISSIRQEISRNLQPLGEESDLFFTYCQKKGIIIVISGLFLDEVFKITKITPELVFEFFLERKLQIELVQSKSDSKEKAFQLRAKTGTPFFDALHITLAMESKVDYIVTWNLRDFENAKQWINSISPRAFVDIP